MHSLLTVAVMAQLGAALSADSVETLRERARRAEAHFERLSRQLAPLSWGGGSGSDCDEIVGRFCLRFDSTSTRPPNLEVEAARIVDARREAVEAIRRYFSAAPSDRRAAGPLVRLLIRDGRAGEAASAAGAFAALSGDTLWGSLLQGLAHHWAGSGTAAERHFITALGRMEAEERRRWLDPSWLLEPPEQRGLRRMTAEARADYERRLWLIMDPFWLTPANERWNEHIGRHVEARLLADVPTVSGMVRWGADLDELTVRYGTPSSRTRERGTGLSSDGLVEYWDTAQRAYAPARLLEGPAGQPDPGARPALFAAAARSGYALRTVNRVLEPAHQITRFLRGDTVLVRVDAAMPFPGANWSRDSARAGPAVSPPVPRVGFFLYDSAFTTRSSATGVATLDGDTARFTLFAAGPAGRLVYSAELLGDSASDAGRARYALDAYIPQSGPVLSDLLIARRFAPGTAPDRMDDPRLRPYASLTLSAGDTLGIYAEVYRLTHTADVDIQLALESADRPSLLGRFARWIGRGLGLIEPGDDPRVGWRGQPVNERYIVALNVPIEEGTDGLHELVLQVTDAATGERTETRRRILIRR